MSKDYEARRLIDTESTLKWFIVIGMILIIIGIFFLWINIPFIGIITIGIGFILVFISLFSIFYLWLAHKVLLRSD